MRGLLHQLHMLALRWRAQAQIAEAEVAAELEPYLRAQEALRRQEQDARARNDCKALGNVRAARKALVHSALEPLRGRG